MINMFSDFYIICIHTVWSNESIAMKAMKEHAFEKNETTPDLQSAKDRRAAGK